MHNPTIHDPCIIMHVQKLLQEAELLKAVAAVMQDVHENWLLC